MIDRPWLDSSAEHFSADNPFVPTGNLESLRKTAAQKRSYLWVAEFHDGNLPNQADFKKYSCLEVTNHGVTFVWPRPSITQQVIVAIGTVESAIYLLAEVKAREEISLNHYRIECQFLKRYES
jgi:hypothetical protein